MKPSFPNEHDQAATKCDDDFEDYPGRPHARYTPAKMKARSTALQPGIRQIPKSAPNLVGTLMLTT